MNKNRLSKLKYKLLNVALSSKEFEEELNNAKNEIIDGANSSKNEATVESIFENVFYALLKNIGIKFSPEKEETIDTKIHIGKGRMDSRLGSVVIEYKHKSKLNSTSDVSAAQIQLQEYIKSLSVKISSDIVGFLTDGLSIFEIHGINGEITSISGRQKLTFGTLRRFVETIISLEQSALNSKNLISDFCGSSYNGVLFKVARLLNVILETKSTPKTDMLRLEWEELFRLAHDDKSQQKRIEQRISILSEIFNEKLTDVKSEYRTLYALHTSYAIVLKFMAYRVVSDIQFGSALQDYKSLIESDSAILRSFCFSLEDGEIFRQLGILNLLEGDFFSWYSDVNQWNDELSDSLREIMEILGRYEDISKIFSKLGAIDLFRELYEATVPQIVRASFGEFYTPYWLADYVLNSSELKNNWKVLDPCCGSGTFIIAAISHLREEEKQSSKKELLKKLLTRIVAIDLNPLAVLTTRINYFIHISDLLSESNGELVIPVFLGDSSYTPEKIKVAGVNCLEYKLKTLKDSILIKFPISLVENTSRFVNLMYQYEKLVKEKDLNGAADLLISKLDSRSNKCEITKLLFDLTRQLVNLEIKGWNGIWARIITNYLTTACLTGFTNIVGNPPWIDWKNLPSGYRNNIKESCIDKGLFSGAGQTGGINLNICALITHVAITNWLDNIGRLAFLMPRELAYQASYEGWRKSVGGSNRNILKFYDWSKAGHPFDPVKEDFMTYVIGQKADKEVRENTIPLKSFILKKGIQTNPHNWKNIEEALNNLEEKDSVAGQIINGSTIYTFSKNREHLLKFKMIAGECEYIGREGIEFYPQELLIFKYLETGPRPETVFLKNIQVSKSKYKIPQQKILLETKYLYPLIKGREIEYFKHNYDDLIVAFPYDSKDPRKPLDKKALDNESPLLLKYYEKYEKTIRSQTEFSDRIRGQNAGEFYGLARTGAYSFQKIYVCFRDNTKWRAAVVSEQQMPWGEHKRLQFQNHAVSICERSDGRGFIENDEAYYICGILNAPIAEEFIYSSSDTRSFKIRPPIYIPLYDKKDKIHKQISELAKTAHLSSEEDRANIRRDIEEMYLELCKRGNN